MKIGLIGRGFVGNSVYEGMTHAFEIYWYDKFKKSDDPKQLHDIKRLIESVDGPIFLCVPTPMKKNGAADISIIEQVVAEVSLIASVVDPTKTRQPTPVLVIKSTVPPGTTEMLNQKYEYVECVFNPEFLREATAVEDFKNQDRIIIGGPHRAASIVKQMYQHAYPEVPTVKTSSTIAEMVKYVTNCFLSVKVAFANEIAQICEKLEVDYDKLVEYVTKDKRLGTSHWAVPGHDGHKGFGLTCFPKDLNALITVAHALEVDPKVMAAAWAKNLEVRPERDWEELKGRAVSQ
jgi:UDPglucose 6-dehydrogenase